MKVKGLELTDSGLKSLVSLSDLPEDRLGKDYTILYYKGTGTEYSHWQGDFTLNQEALESMVSNFDAKVIGTDVQVNYGHNNSDKAAGWIKSLKLSEDKRKLLADIEWTPAAAKAIREKEYCYFSAEFVGVGYNNSNSNKTYNNVLTGGALTNIPFLKSTNITLEDGMNKEQLIKTLKETHGLDVESQAVALSATQTELSAIKTELSAAKAGLAQAQTELNDLRATAKKEKLEALFNAALTKGRALPAQKAMFCAWMESIDLSTAEAEIEKMPKIIKTEATSLQETGTVETPAGGETEAQLLDQRIEEYRVANASINLTYEQAYNEVKAKG